MGEQWFSTRNGPISVKAGDPLAEVSGTGLDWSVHDADVILPGFVIPEHYTGEIWKIHTVDPFQYYEEPLKSELLSKAVRQVEPRSGKIDYDVDGALSGNWFQSDTDWYNGINQRKYWEGHLSIAPHEIDPTLWRIAVGFLDRENNNFIIVGKHTPSNVISMDKPVSYELKRYMVHISSQPDKNWWNDPYSENDVYGVKLFPHVEGTVLLHLQEDGLLNLEVFLGKRQEEIDGFTNNARLYQR